MKFLREPLVHFLLLGAVLFGGFALLGRWSVERPEQILISSGLVENLRLSFERSTGRAPTDRELDTAVEEYIREEILTREAIALGLHHDDPIVRRQLRQRMEFLQSDDASATPPTDAELQAFLEANAAQFQKRGETEKPALEDVRAAVTRAWEGARRRAALDASYAKLRERYEVVIEKPEEAAK